MKVKLFSCTHYNEENIIVGFDLDGVIIDHTQNKMRIVARFGIMLTPGVAACGGSFYSGEYFFCRFTREKVGRSLWIIWL